MSPPKKKISIFRHFTFLQGPARKPHENHLLTKVSGTRDLVTDQLAQELPSHYLDPKTIAARARLLGFKETARAIQPLLPTTAKARSGDLGEILAYEYAQNELNLHVPIKKLRWKDSRDMALRGEDLIALAMNGKNIDTIIKGEVKSRANLTKAVVNEIAEALSSFSGRLNPHAVLFVAARLRDSGQKNLAEKIESLILKSGVSAKIEHLGFAFVGNDPSSFLNENLKNYRGRIKRTMVGVKVEDHPGFIKTVFAKASK